MRGMIQARLTSIELDLTAPSQQDINRISVMMPGFVSQDLLTNGACQPETLFASSSDGSTLGTLFMGPARSRQPGVYYVTSIVKDQQNSRLIIRSLNLTLRGKAEIMVIHLLSAVFWLSGGRFQPTSPNGPIRLPVQSFFPFSGAADTVDLAAEYLNKPDAAVLERINRIISALLSFRRPVASFTAALDVKRDCGAGFHLIIDSMRRSESQAWQHLATRFSKPRLVNNLVRLRSLNDAADVSPQAQASKLPDLLQTALEPGELSAMCEIFSALCDSQDACRCARSWIERRAGKDWRRLVAKVEAINILGLASSAELEDLLRLMLPERLQVFAIAEDFLASRQFLHQVLEELVFMQSFITNEELYDALDCLMGTIDEIFGFEGRTKALSHLVVALTQDPSYAQRAHALLPQILRIVATLCEQQPLPNSGKQSKKKKATLRLVAPK